MAPAHFGGTPHPPITTPFSHGCGGAERKPQTKEEQTQPPPKQPQGLGRALLTEATALPGEQQGRAEAGWGKLGGAEAAGREGRRTARRAGGRAGGLSAALGPQPGGPGSGERGGSRCRGRGPPPAAPRRGQARGKRAAEGSVRGAAGPALTCRGAARAPPLHVAPRRWRWPRPRPPARSPCV